MTIRSPLANTLSTLLIIGVFRNTASFVVHPVQRTSLNTLMQSSQNNNEEEADFVFSRRRRRGRRANEDADTEEDSFYKRKEKEAYLDDDEDDFDYDVQDEYDDDEDDDWDDDEEDYDIFGNDIVPNAFLDSMDPDGAAERFPELARDPRFWFDMLLFVTFLDLLSIIGPRDPYPDIPWF